MKYEVELTRQEIKTVEVVAETPEEAAHLARDVAPEFRATTVTEVFGDGMCGESFEVVGGCEACGSMLCAHSYHTGAEGVLVCDSCFAALVAAR